MSYLIMKAVISGVIVLVFEVARRSSGFGALVASLPLVSIVGMIRLWRETTDTMCADHARTTFWFVPPSLPMFLLVPVLLRWEVDFWPAPGLGCLLTVALYLAMVNLAQLIGPKL